MMTFVQAWRRDLIEPFHLSPENLLYILLSMEENGKFGNEK